MSSRLREHIRANVVGYIALFVALCGTAWAAGTIGSHEVINNSLRSVDLKDDAAVSSADVIDDTSGGGLGRPDLATGSVGSDEIGDGSVTGVDVASGSLTGSDIDESTLNLNSSQIDCRGGTVQGVAWIPGSGLADYYTTLFGSHSCGGTGVVKGKRLGPGDYMVAFSRSTAKPYSDPTILATATVRSGVNGSMDNLVDVQFDTNTPSYSYFEVREYDNDGSPEDGDVVVTLP
jgi:hypothetical protein